MLATGCALLTGQDERLRMEQVEGTVLPMARVALDTGQTETASRLYNRLLDVDPLSPQAHLGLGDVALAQRDADAAADWYLAAHALAQTPEQRQDALLAHGRAALDAGRLEAAHHSFLQLTDSDDPVPANVAAWGHNGVGLTLLLQGDLEGAVAAMQQAVRRAPREERFRDNLQRALDMRDELGAAPRQRDGSALVGTSPRPPARDPAPSSPPSVPERGAGDRPAALPEAASEDAQTPKPIAAPEAIARDAPAATPIVAPAAREAPAPAPVIPPEAIAGEAQAPTLAAPLEAASRDAQAPPTVRQDDTSAGAAADAPNDAGIIEWLGPAPTTAADAPTPPAAAPAASALVVTDGGRRFLQLGSFRNRRAAESLVEYLQGLTDEPVFMAEGDLHGQPLYRVRAGPLASEAALGGLREAVEAAGYGAN